MVRTASSAIVLPGPVSSEGPVSPEGLETFVGPSAAILGAVPPNPDRCQAKRDSLTIVADTTETSRGTNVLFAVAALILVAAGLRATAPVVNPLVLGTEDTARQRVNDDAG
jgi:hypothetical protein